MARVPEIKSLRPYSQSPTARLFHASNKLVRGVKGPVGSGKSVMCAMELFSRALEQAPDPNGIRKTRFAIVRNTFPELSTTTLKTVQDWIPPGLMKYTMSSPLKGMLDVNLADGTRLHSEWLFLALDVDADVAKLKSLEVTMVWLNEASEIQRSVLDVAQTRLGRYPAKVDGGATYTGLIFDSNPPDDSHWIYELGEVKKPEEFVLLNQPPAVLRAPVKEGDPPRYVPNDGTHKWHQGPPAENIEHLQTGWDYYMRPIKAGKDPEWIRVYFMGEYGTLTTGRAVYSEYNDAVHMAKETISPYRGLPLLLGWDFGLNASCVFGQMTPGGGVNIIDELTSEEMGIERFVREMVIPKLKAEYHELRVIGCGDPAGAQRAQTNEVTCFQILGQNGFDVTPAMTNDFASRREAVSYFLTRMVNGKPAFQLSPKCSILRKGFLGRYHYRKLKIGGSARFTERPDKNEYSHLHDALQYLCLYLKEIGPSSSTGTGFEASPERKRNVDYGKIRRWI